MKSFPKSTLSLLVVLGSSLGILNPALAQQPNQMQIYQKKCSQGDQYSCIQLEEWYRRNSQWEQEHNNRHDQYIEDVKEHGRQQREWICREGARSRGVNADHCAYTR